ncbi:unnamed protein product [Camellia sinensis]
MFSSLSIIHQSMLRSFHGHKSVQDNATDEYYVVYENYSRSLRAHINNLKNQPRVMLEFRSLQNQQFEEPTWHDGAYPDVLTGLYCLRLEWGKHHPQP